MSVITKDIEFSHSILSYVISALQGEFAYQNILKRLGSTSMNEEEAKELQQKIQEVSQWLEQTLSGKPILQLEWDEPKSSEGKKVFAMSRELISDMKALATDLDSILTQKQFDEVPRNRIAILLAVLGKQTYARDNYFRCFYKLYKHFGNTEESARFRIGVKSSEKDLEHVNSFIVAFQGYSDLPLEFYHALFGEIIAMPGLLRTQAFDLMLLCAAYKKTFSLRTFLRKRVSSGSNSVFRPTRLDTGMPIKYLRWKLRSGCKVAFLFPLWQGFGSLGTFPQRRRLDGIRRSLLPKRHPIGQMLDFLQRKRVNSLNVGFLILPSLSELSTRTSHVA